MECYRLTLKCLSRAGVLNVSSLVSVTQKYMDLSAEADLLKQVTRSGPLKGPPQILVLGLPAWPQRQGVSTAHSCCHELCRAFPAMMDYDPLNQQARLNLSSKFVKYCTSQLCNTQDTAMLHGRFNTPHVTCAF